MNLDMDRDYESGFETGDINDPRTFERFLREQGFSRNRAKAITAKGFKCSDRQPDMKYEISSLVTDLKARQVYLETKKSGLIGDILEGAASGFAQGITETMLSRYFDRKVFEDADKMLRDFEVSSSRERSKHTVGLVARGAGKLVKFPMNHKRSRLTLSISLAGRERIEDHKIKAILRYPSWSKNSVKRERLDIDSSDYQGVIREQVTVGAGTAISAWLASITDNKFRQAKSELAGRGWPELWLEYDGSRMGANIKSAKFAVTLQ